MVPARMPRKAHWIYQITSLCEKWELRTITVQRDPSHILRRRSGLRAGFSRSLRERSTIFKAGEWLLRVRRIVVYQSWFEVGSNAGNDAEYYTLCRVANEGHRISLYNALLFAFSEMAVTYMNLHTYDYSSLFNRLSSSKCSLSAVSICHSETVLPSTCPKPCWSLWF